MLSHRRKAAKTYDLSIANDLFICCCLRFVKRRIFRSTQITEELNLNIIYTFKTIDRDSHSAVLTNFFPFLCLENNIAKNVTVGCG